MLTRIILLIACVSFTAAVFDEPCSENAATAYADIFILLENTQLVADEFDAMKGAIVEWVGRHTLTPSDPSSPIYSRFALMLYGQTFSFESALGEWKNMDDVNKTFDSIGISNNVQANPAFALDGVLGSIRQLAKANSTRPITVLLFSSGIHANNPIDDQAEKVKYIATLATMGVGNDSASLASLDSFASSGVAFRFPAQGAAASLLTASSRAACYCESTSNFHNQYMNGTIPTSTCHTSLRLSENYTIATAYCAHIGGWLVTETSSAKRRYMNQFAVWHFGNDYFIGLRRIDENSLFLWNGTDKLVYRDWAAGFPLSGVGNDCVISNDMDWETTACSTEQEFFCENRGCDASNYCDAPPSRYINF